MLIYTMKIYKFIVLKNISHNIINMSIFENNNK